MPNIKILKPFVPIKLDQIKVYRFAAPKVSTDSILQVARAFHLKGDPNAGKISSLKNEIHYDEGIFAVRQSVLTGSVKYRNTVEYQKDDGKSNVQFKPEEAIEIATSYVKATNIANLAEYDIRNAKITTLSVGGSDINLKQVDPTRAIDNGVVLQRMIDNIPVDGPGGKTFVFINAAKQVTAFESYARKIEGVEATIPASGILTVDEAQRNLETFYKAANQDITIQEIRFGYFELGWNDKQTFLEPAYVMPIILNSPESRMRSGSIYIVPALRKPYELVMPVAPQTPRQPVRAVVK
jgi:hypothetical protein